MVRKVCLMSTSPDPREQYGTHMLPGRSYEEEFVRLRLQNQLFTSGMGGLWPEQPSGAEYHRVLDVGCCSGCWLVQVARTYPARQHLFGVDIDSYMIAQARAFASEQGVADRVEFHAMDALRMLEFPFNYLDLVSMQLGGGNFLRTWEWPKLLQEVLRVTRPGGTLRVVESNVTQETTSPALDRQIKIIKGKFKH